MPWQLFSIEPPTQWRAGTVGRDRTPFYFNCADCGAKEPPIAGFIGTGPTFADIGVLPAGPDGCFRKVAMFCGPCFAKRQEAAELAGSPA